MNPFGWYRVLIRNPKYRWLVILGSLVYLISPLDLFPDLVPFVGQIDDVILVTLLFSEVFQRLLGGTGLDSSNADFASQANPQTYEATDPTVTTVDVDAVSVNDQTQHKQA